MNNRKIATKHFLPFYFLIILCLSFGVVFNLSAQNANTKFRQMDDLLPAPNRYRSASGAPGPDYWQQRADYDISVELDENLKKIIGSETITYYNNSPEELTYLWVQLDQNIRRQHADAYTTETHDINNENSFNDILKYKYRDEYDGGYKITNVKSKDGALLNHKIYGTMMRIDLPKALKPASNFAFSIDWHYNINDAKKLGGRTGYECFEQDGNCIFELAEWYPRMAQFNDYEGWQHKQYLGRGEFTLGFGNFTVNITVPADHLVAATGELQNPNDVLSQTQRIRLKMAEDATQKPVIIVTQDEAILAEKSKNNTKKTWKFKAEKVRDFAWASSRKFIWDAMATYVGGKKVMCMSFYPKEGNPLWEQYSTRVVAHTIDSYSRHAVNYEWPVAISVNGPVGGMEYPMICFNGPRPEADGTYSEATKIGLISVIIHEVGHNFFPMIISSDERQWTWQDEGFNVFCQYLAEQEWDRNYPSRRGLPEQIVPYMKGDPAGLDPIMTSSDEILQFGNNAYAKTATGLNILRETILGVERFDFAFKEYCRRWAYKHPTPADFFRTMEDAAGTDLDWFFRGWFYTTEPCDQSLASVEWLKIDTQNPDIENPIIKKQAASKPIHPSKLRVLQDEKSTVVEKYPELRDFYSDYDPLKVTKRDRERYKKYYDALSDEEKALLNSSKNLYQLKIENKAGLIMPIILEFTFSDGTKNIERIPAEIWRYNNKEVRKLFIFDKEVSSITLDPYLELPDIDRSNNRFPSNWTPNKVRLENKTTIKGLNPMQLEKSIEK